MAHGHPSRATSRQAAARGSRPHAAGVASAARGHRPSRSGLRHRAVRRATRVRCAGCRCPAAAAGRGPRSSGAAGVPGVRAALPAVHRCRACCRRASPWPLRLHPPLRAGPRPAHTMPRCAPGCRWHAASAGAAAASRRCAGNCGRSGRPRCRDRRSSAGRANRRIRAMRRGRCRATAATASRAGRRATAASPPARPRRSHAARAAGRFRPGRPDGGQGRGFHRRRAHRRMRDAAPRVPRLRCPGRWIDRLRRARPAIRPPAPRTRVRNVPPRRRHRDAGRDGHGSRAGRGGAGRDPWPAGAAAPWSPVRH